jgi:hypothetical protein
MAETSYEMSDDIGVGVVASGFVHLLRESQPVSSLERSSILSSKFLTVSQLSTRIISFILNLVIARHLTPEAYGVSGQPMTAQKCMENREVGNPFIPSFLLSCRCQLYSFT